MNAWHICTETKAVLVAARIRVATIFERVSQRIGQSSPLLKWFPAFSRLMAEQFAWAITIPLGVGLGQWDEYGAALAFFGFGCLSLIFKAFQWKGVTSAFFTNAVRVLWVASVFLGFCLSYSLTLSKKGDKPWSEYLATYLEIPEFPHTHTAAFDAPSVPDLGGISPSPPRPFTPKKLKPDVSLILVHPQKFDVIIANNSDVLISQAKYWFGIWDLDRLGPEGNPQTLQIPVALTDWIRPRKSAGPEAIISDNRIQPPAKDGDRLVGFMGVSCPACVKTKTYFVCAVVGQGGWYKEVPGIRLDSFAAAIPKIKLDPERFFADIPQGSRTQIKGLN